MPADLSSHLIITLGLTGFTNVGADPDSAEYWQLDQRNELPLLGRLVVELPAVDVARGVVRSVRREARRLPDGDVMVIIDGVSWARYTNDPARRADHAIRSTIWAHRYEKKLIGALCELERRGRAPGLAHTWFGGTAHVPKLMLTCTESSHSGGFTSTAEEKLERLREYLTEVGALDWAGAMDARVALELLHENSIVALVREPN